MVRIFCDSYSGNSLAAYTNSYILNGKVFVPLFGIPADEPALETYQNAMPGYEIIGVHHDSWYCYDALHCRTREMIDREMLLIQHRPLDSLVPSAPDFAVECLVRPYSGEALIPDETFLRYREAGTDPWTTVPLVAIGGDSLAGQIPTHPVGTVVEYYLGASDLSGRTETLPRTAPEGVFSFTVDSGLGFSGSAGPHVAGFSAVPNPFQTSVNLTFTLATEGTAVLSAFDLAGRSLMTTVYPCLASGSHTVVWDAEGFAPGVYMITVLFGGETRTLRAVRVH